MYYGLVKPAWPAYRHATVHYALGQRLSTACMAGARPPGLWVALMLCGYDGMGSRELTTGDAAGAGA